MSEITREFNFITEVKFQEEGKAIPFKCWSENGYINVKLNIETGGTLRTKLDTKYAQLFIEKAIPAILEEESELIQAFLNE